MVRRRSALEIVTIQPSTPSSPTPDPVGALEGRALATWNLAGSSTAWFCLGPQSGLRGWAGGGVCPNFQAPRGDAADIAQSYPCATPALNLPLARPPSIPSLSGCSGAQLYEDS